MGDRGKRQKEPAIIINTNGMPDMRAIEPPALKLELRIAKVMSGGAQPYMFIPVIGQKKLLRLNGRTGLCGFGKKLLIICS
ncbi:hypothetical protein D3C76_517940 [compost metagenome]